jgi:hypothetical protein
LGLYGAWCLPQEDPEEYYDVDDGARARQHQWALWPRATNQPPRSLLYVIGYDDDDRVDEQSPKKVVYPPRLMVDFTSLGVRLTPLAVSIEGDGLANSGNLHIQMNALLRYAQFYQITVRDDYDKDELAAVVARHFDGTLDVEEDESIVSFMQRIRNGEKAVVRHRPPEKDRKAKQQQRKKSNSTSRKRQREASLAGGGAAHSTGVASGSTSAKDGGANGSADAKSGSHHGSHRGGDLDDDAPVAARPTARSKPSGPSSSSSSSAHGSSSDKTGPSSKSNGNGTKKSSDKSKKDHDNGEDNELYCICNLPSYGNMIACDGKKCPNPSQWYHLECVGFSDGRHPDTWLCPECDPKSFAEFKNKKKKNGNKPRSKSPGSK